MNPKPTGWLALVTLLLTTIWLVLLAMDLAHAGPLVTYEQVLAYVSRLDVHYYALYVVTGLLTATTAMFMAGLCGIYRDTAPSAVLFAFVFVPVYAAFNLFVYFSQVTVVPALIAQRQAAQSPAVDVVLRQMLQQSPGSAIGFANALAYAALAIPSAIIGWLLWQDDSERNDLWPRIAGSLLLLSGVLSLAGFASLLVEAPSLEIALVAGGGVFWLSLFPLSYWLLRSHQ